jgi:transposase
MKIDVALDKYCDLIPVERYSAIAGRAGLEDLPPQSLIESTHQLADFVKGAYEKSKVAVAESKVINADETPHKMLEGDPTKNWYLWGFSTKKASYFEIHDTRSGDVASNILLNSKCEFLVSDVFSGYERAVREANEKRQELNPSILLIKNVYCNAHSRRKFKEAPSSPEETRIFIVLYKRIYNLEGKAKGKPPDKILEYRQRMTPLFAAMKTRALGIVANYSAKSKMGKALSYFLENYDELTLFLSNLDLPIDNNSQERLMRNPVVGRKTWYGTHSKRGAETAAILFSLVESCKLVGVNPREYFKKLVADLHLGRAPYIPWEFKQLSKNQ